MTPAERQRAVEIAESTLAYVERCDAKGWDYDDVTRDEITLAKALLNLHAAQKEERLEYRLIWDANIAGLGWRENSFPSFDSGTTLDRVKQEVASLTELGDRNFRIESRVPAGPWTPVEEAKK